MFHELPKGGGERAVFEISKGLKKKGVIVDLYTTHDGTNIPKEIFKKNYIYKFPVKNWQGGNWKRRLYKDTFEILRLYLLHKKIAKDINERKYDFAFINSSQFIENPFVLRFLKTKSVAYCHDPHDRLIYDPINKIPKDIGIGRNIYERTFRFLRKINDKRNINHANFLLANSKYTKQIIKKTYGLESEVMYLGVNEKDFFPEKQEKKNDILFIGSTSKFDGFELYLEVLRRLPKGIRARSILAEQEWISGKEALRKVFLESKIVLSFGVREPFGLIPLEAMSCGIPVIAVVEAGYKESVVNNKTGYLVKRDSREIANKIMSLLKNNSKREEMGFEARREILDKWTWEKSTDQIYDFLLRNLNNL